MSVTRDGFLSRWSRLKRDGPAEAPEAQRAAEATAPAPTGTEHDLPEGKTLEELVAELPKVEDLVPGQSVSAFMQAWVPAPLRNAALQRMWLLDPAIRDYVNPALDYAYDYNTPGCAPGFGTMEASEEAVREVSEMFDRALGRSPGQDDKGEGCDGTTQESASDLVAVQQSEATRHPMPEVATDELTAGDVAPLGTGGTPVHAAMHETPAAEVPFQRVRGKNGSALPR